LLFILLPGDQQEQQFRESSTQIKPTISVQIKLPRLYFFNLKQMCEYQRYRRVTALSNTWLSLFSVWSNSSCCTKNCIHIYEASM